MIPYRKPQCDCASTDAHKKYNCTAGVKYGKDVFSIVGGWEEEGGYFTRADWVLRYFTVIQANGTIINGFYIEKIRAMGGTGIFGAFFMLVVSMLANLVANSREPPKTVQTGICFYLDILQVFFEVRMGSPPLDLPTCLVLPSKIFKFLKEESFNHQENVCFWKINGVVG